MTTNYGLPWIEKYRPQTLNDMIDHNEKIQTLRKLINTKQLTHLIFYGPPGCGKTSMILACAREMYGDQMSKYILELNASDERGIETVRTIIPQFIKASAAMIKLIILDEVDAMTYDAQSALRRVIEKYSKTSRFCLICNNINKIIPGLQSRCAKMRFGRLSNSEIKKKLLHIISEEHVSIGDDGLDRLIEVEPDFRQILNTLQCLHIQKKDTSVIHANDVNQYLGIPTSDAISQMYSVLTTKTINESSKYLIDIFMDNQWNMPDIIHQLLELVVNSSNINEVNKYHIIDKLVDIQCKLNHSNDTEVQIYALVGAFQQVSLGK